MRWINKLSDTDIEKLLKKLGVEYENRKKLIALIKYKKIVNLKECD